MRRVMNIPGAAGAQQARKRHRAAGEGGDDWGDSDAEDAEALAGRRGAPRRKGATAKEQKKVNEKARRQRENEL